MKQGYEAELTNHQSRLNEVKSHMEAFYAERHEDKNIVDDLLKRYEDLMAQAETTMFAYTNGVKIVKAAIVPSLMYFKSLKFGFINMTKSHLPRPLEHAFTEAPPKPKAKAKSKGKQAPGAVDGEPTPTESAAGVKEEQTG